MIIVLLLLCMCKKQLKNNDEFIPEFIYRNSGIYASTLILLHSGDRKCNKRHDNYIVVNSLDDVPERYIGYVFWRSKNGTKQYKVTKSPITVLSLKDVADVYEGSFIIQQSMGVRSHATNEIYGYSTSSIGIYGHSNND